MPSIEEAAKIYAERYSRNELRGRVIKMREALDAMYVKKGDEKSAAYQAAEQTWRAYGRALQIKPKPAATWTEVKYVRRAYKELGASDAEAEEQAAYFERLATEAAKNKYLAELKLKLQRRAPAAAKVTARKMAAKAARPKVKPDDQIVLEYGVVRNQAPGREGYWVPMMWRNDKREGSTASSYKMEHDEALKMAKERVESEASHYVGDWDIVVRARKNGEKPRARKHVYDVTKMGKRYGKRFKSEEAAKKFARKMNESEPSPVWQVGAVTPALAPPEPIPAAEKPKPKPKRRTFKQAREELLTELERRRWTVKRGLKVPHATSPEGDFRLWLKPQAVWSSEGVSHSLKGARSLHGPDLRDFSPSEWLDRVLRSQQQLRAQDRQKIEQRRAERAEAYELKQEEKVERLRARAEKKRAEARSAEAGARAISEHIPMGQPILVGHHSEKRHRRDLDRIHRGHMKAFEAEKQAKSLERRAARAEVSRVVSSDDPTAISKLQAKLGQIEEQRELAKKINKAVRSKDPRAGLQALGLKERTIENALTPDFAGRKGVPDYELKNLGAEARRLKQRIAVLEKEEKRAIAQPVKRSTVGDIEIVEAADDNRIRLIFPGKPSAEVRKILKSSGFRWSPRAGAWQRQLNERARYVAGETAKRIVELGKAPTLTEFQKTALAAVWRREQALEAFYPDPEHRLAFDAFQRNKHKLPELKRMGLLETRKIKDYPKTVLSEKGRKVLGVKR